MTYPISDEFADPLGRWDGFAPWDATEHSQSEKAFLTTQTHVDLRNFRTVNSTVAIPQNPDLDTVAQTVLDGEPQTALETKLGAPLLSENWVLGGTGLSTLVVGEIAARGGWSGAQLKTTGAAVNATLTSSMPNRSVDISAMTSVGFIAPDYNSFDTSTSTLQFSSSADGTFGSGHDSAAVAFSSALDSAPEFRFNISAFANSGFDNTKITGVKLVLKKSVAPSSNLTVTFLALRAVTNAWQESALDFDTCLNAIYRPVTLSGNNYAGTTAKAFEFVRGDGTKLDPIPADGAFYLYFYPGGATSPNDATGTTFNTLTVIMREHKDIADGLGNHISARLKWNDSASSFTTVYSSSTGGSPGTVVDSGTHTESIGPALDPNSFYVYRVELRGTQIVASLYTTDINRNILAHIWTNLSDTNAAYVYSNGRVGFVADLQSRDAFVTAFDVATTGFAIFQTEVFNRRTPVDGAQLAAVFSEDLNLFQSVTGPDLFVDQTKTLSGLGSFRTQRSITTNAFVIDDWTQTYLSLAIWVPSTVTFLNQPVIFLNTGSGQEMIPLDRLQAAQWNTINFDLGIFRNLLTATSYSITVSGAPQPDRALGYFWVDEIVVGRRRVDWAIKATPNGAWRSFRGLVNDKNGAIHFTPEERGTALQLQATALTEDAWSATFKLFPRIAQLGLPVYDQSFETS